MVSVRTLSVGFAIVAGLGVLVAAGPARADWDDHDGWHHRWHHGWHRDWHEHGRWHHWRSPAVVVAPRPYYYARPPVVYAPPPAYYAPPPVYYAPGVSFGFTVR